MKTSRVRQPNLAAGQVRSVPAYYEGQNARGEPDHYESVESASRLKAQGKARSINRGTAVLILGPRQPRWNTRDSKKGRWKVVGQTPLNALRPGFPRYASV